MITGQAATSLCHYCTASIGMEDASWHNGSGQIFCSERCADANRSDDRFVDALNSMRELEARIEEMRANREKFETAFSDLYRDWLAACEERDQALAECSRLQAHTGGLK